MAMVMDIILEKASPGMLLSLQALLIENGLPVVGIDQNLETAVVAIQDGELIGSAALELYGSAALLRSVAVTERARGCDVGKCLVDRMISIAEQHNVRELFLLTETAVDYFPRFGFQNIPRHTVNPAVQQSLEFTDACPETAQAMRLLL